MNEQERKESRLNIIVMAALALVLLTGIVLRRDFIVSELKATILNMFSAADTTSVTVKENAR